jgi:hypothetical protein
MLDGYSAAGEHRPG